jgi:hypothetical protein
LTAVSTGTLAIRFYMSVVSALSGAMPFLDIPNNGFPVSIGSQTSGTGWQVTTTTLAYSGTTIETGAWQCVELDLDLDAGQFSLYASDATSSDHRPAPIITGSFYRSTISDFYLGIYSSPTAGSADIWFDDVAVAAGHIGCE